MLTWHIRQQPIRIVCAKKRLTPNPAFGGRPSYSTSSMASMVSVAVEDKGLFQRCVVTLEPVRGVDLVDGETHVSDKC